MPAEHEERPGCRHEHHPWRQVDRVAVAPGRASVAGSVWEFRDEGWSLARGTVVVSADDLRTVLSSRNRHLHRRPGFWDSSGEPCAYCAACGRLCAAIGMGEAGDER